MTRRLTLFWLTLALVGAALAVWFHRMLAGEVLFWGLPSLQFYPWRHFAFEQVLAGSLPTWNPYLGGGAPLLANYQTALFYPPNWLHLILPNAYAMSLIALAHVFWAALGMWLFSGTLGLSPLGRSVSMLAFALSGYLVGRIGSFPTASSAAWIPWLFWMTQRVITHRRWPDAGWLGLIFGLQLLTGHAQTTWYSGLGVGLYALWQVLWGQRTKPLKVRTRGAGLAALGMILGLAAAAVQLIPTAEYLLQSQRSGGVDYERVINLSYAPLRLLTLLSPNFFGTPADGSYLTEGIYFEDALYLGFVPFLMALLAIAGRVRQRRRVDRFPALRTVPFWTILALAAMVIALGRYGPVFRVLYDHVPTFDAFREPVRWLILTEFSLAVLAGIGVSHWQRGHWVDFWSRLAAAGGAGMVILGLLAPEVMADSGETVRVLAAGLAALGALTVSAALLTLAQPQDGSPRNRRWWQAAVLVVAAADLTWAGYGLNPTVPASFYDEREITPPAGRIYWREDYEETIKYETYFTVDDYTTADREWRAVRASGLPNLNMLDEIPALNNFDPLQPRYYQRYIAIIEALDQQAAPLLHAAGVSRVYGPSPLTGSEREIAPLTTHAQGFAYLVPDAAWYADDQALEQALQDPAWDPAQTVLLIGTPPAAAAPERTSGTGTVSVREQTPTQLRYTVETDAPAYLVLAHAWYPGWESRINGRRVPLERANLMFQAVRVPAGHSDVALTYRLNYWTPAVLITLTGIGAAALLIAAGRRTRPTRSPGNHKQQQHDP